MEEDDLYRSFLAPDPRRELDEQRQQRGGVQGGGQASGGGSTQPGFVGQLKQKALGAVVDSIVPGLGTVGSFLFEDGTPSVPDVDAMFGGDPLMKDEMGNLQSRGKMVDAGRITSAGINAVDAITPYVGPVLNVLGFEHGSPHVPMPGYAEGTDTVPAMLTPGEAVTPRGAAQNPMNKPAIEAMIQEGRTGIPAQDQMVSPQQTPTTKEQREDAIWSCAGIKLE